MVIRPLKKFLRACEVQLESSNSRGHTTIIEGPNLFCQKSSFQPPKKMASFKNLKKTLLPRPLPGSRAKKEANLIICTNAREKILRKG